mmetsp:Transcript_79128/g.181082  ORF Transcript_79128/g.181082 Transcript_79128/m.181082 type:complete len:197 (-) Transcript_79128:604-1194(-)
MFWESEVSISRHGLPAASGVDVYVMQRLLWLVFRSSVVGASLRGSSVSSCLRRLLVLIVVVLEAFDYSSPDTARWLFALVPQHVFHSPTHRCPMPFIWNIVTCHFFDSSILKSVCSACSCVLSVCASAGGALGSFHACAIPWLLLVSQRLLRTALSHSAVCCDSKCQGLFHSCSGNSRVVDSIGCGNGTRIPVDRC